jgi:hypothetical protein
MRKAMWVTLALVLAVAASLAPCARADTATFTCTGDNDDGSSSPPFYGPCFEAAPTAPNVTFSSSGTTLEISWYTAANPSPIAVTLPGTWIDSQSYSWLASNMGFFIYNNSIISFAAYASPINTNLPSGEGISEFGTLTFSPTTAAAPEPGTTTLMLTGIALMLVMRKRVVRGLQQIT